MLTILATRRKIKFFINKWWFYCLWIFIIKYLSIIANTLFKKSRICYEGFKVWLFFQLEFWWMRNPFLIFVTNRREIISIRLHEFDLRRYLQLFIRKNRFGGPSSLCLRNMDRFIVWNVFWGMLIFGGAEGWCGLEFKIRGDFDWFYLKIRW